MAKCFIRQLTPEGLKPVVYAASSFNEAAQYEPDDGVYTVANTFNTRRVLRFDAHLDRLEDSARREHIPLKLDRAALRVALRQMIAEAGFGDVRFRITVPRADPDTCIITLEPFRPLPAEIYKQGIRCITVPEGARHNPLSKTTDWMHDRQSIAATMPAGVYEGLLLNEAGDILEGLSSNFYAVLNDDLRTVGEGVLPGIARQVVFAIAPGIVTVRKDPVNVREIPQFAEAFITSSSRGIVPVVEIDGQRIGDGKPGPRTRALSHAYSGWVASHLENL